MRSVHSACRRRTHPLVCHSRVGGGIQGDRHAGGARHATTSSPDSGSLHQRASRAVRVLHERRHPDRKGISRQESQSGRRTDSAGPGQRTVPVWNASGNYPGCEARGPRSSQDMKPISRRQFVREGRDALIVGFSLHSGISPAIAWSQTPPIPSAKPVIPDELDVVDGIVRVRKVPSKRISYAELIGGRRFSTKLDQGTVGDLSQTLTAGLTTQPVRSGGLHLKGPGELRLVGKSIPRVDVPAKVTGSFRYVHNVRVPMMLHGRVIRPPKIGSTLVSIDESSVSGVAGLGKIVREGNFLGVVAEREEQAIEAARLLKVEWTGGRTLPDYNDLHLSVRGSKPVKTDVVLNSGNVDSALAGAAKVLEATYTYPVQLHAMLGPSCAVADVRDGRATIWSGSQWIQGDRRNLARMLGIPLESVRFIWAEASGSYGRLGCDDAAADAALLSQAAGRPVRVQWMRHDEHGWEPMSPAMTMDVRAALDRQGRITAFDFQQWSQSHSRGESGNFLAWRLAGGNPDWDRLSVGPYPPYYEFPNKRMLGHYVEELFRSIYLRAPGRIQGNFAIESFLDEIAADQRTDPVEFRRHYLKDPMALQVLDAAVQKAGWQARPSPQPNAGESIVSGRGISFGEHGPEKRAVIVAAVEVDRTSGRIRVSRMVIATACGRIINPQGLRQQVQGAVLQGISRTLFEAVKFDRSHVTSLDWRSYPVLTFPDVPEIETALVDQRDVEPSGAGELATVPVAAAVCNAIFDATGVRLRQIPFTPERVKSALG